MLYDFILGDNIALGMEMPILQVLIDEICEDRASDYISKDALAHT
jgi:hypothetical protein